MADGSDGFEALLADLKNEGFAAIADNAEVRGACRAALRNVGCIPPADALIYFAVAKFVVLGTAYLSEGYAARLGAWLIKFKPAAIIFRRIADICLKEKNRNRLKDVLLDEMRGKTAADRPEFDAEADLEIHQQIYAMKRFDSVDADLSSIIGMIQGVLAQRSSEGIAPRLGWDRGSTKSVSDTIRYNSGAYGFVGREDDIAFLRKFLVAEAKFSWLLLTGEGGDGKTRLAMEFTENHLPDGWTGGRLSMSDLDRFDPNQWIPAKPTCIVIDYPAQSPARVRALMANIARSADQNLYDWPVRVILLERNIAGDWYRELLPSNTEASGLRDAAYSEPPVNLGDEPTTYDKGRPVTPIGRRQLLAMMTQRFSDAGVDMPDVDMLWQKLISIDQRKRDGQPAPRPIFAAAVAETLLKSAQRGEIIDDALVREMKRVELLSDMVDRDRREWWKPQAATPATLNLHENMLAMASFAYGFEKRALRDLADVVKDYLPSHSEHGTVPVDADLLKAMSGFESGRLAPLEPDLLGEIHLIERLSAIQEDGGEEAFRAFADCALDIGGQQAVTVALRAVTDFPELMPKLGWMLPVKRTDRADVLRDARLAIDLVTSVPLPEVAKLFDWFDEALDTAPHDVELAKAAARTAWSYVQRATNHMGWPIMFGRNGDRLAALNIDSQQLDERVLARALALSERLVEAFPEDTEVQVTLARILRAMASTGEPQDRSEANMALRARADRQAWTALKVADGGTTAGDLAFVGNWDANGTRLIASFATDSRPTSLPRPAGLAWHAADPQDASQMLRLVAREALLDGGSAWLDSSGVTAAWHADVKCSTTHKLWAFNPGNRWSSQVVLLSDGHSVHHCDGGSAVFHNLVSSGAFRFDTVEQAADYLVMFAGLIRGDSGAFEIVQSPADLSFSGPQPDKQASMLASTIKPMAITKVEDRYVADVFVRYDRNLFSAQMQVEQNGFVTMLDDELLGELEEIAVDSYDGIFRRYADANYAQLAARLLRDAGTFFGALGGQNPSLTDQMTENKSVFEQVASLVEANPVGAIEDRPINSVTAQLLRDAATFFENLSEQNADIREQMTENAAVFRQVANLVEIDPFGTPTSVVSGPDGSGGTVTIGD